MKQETIITITEIATILNLTEADIVAGKCHTGELSKIEGEGFLLSEVKALLARLKHERTFFLRLA